MMRFIFFTKTNWDEPPRLRHQLAQLLISHNHQIIFFEKPSTLLFHKKRKVPKINGIEFLRSRQLIHQKLRIFKFLRFLNKKFELIEIKRKLINSKTTKSDIIVNFNYDYYFLKKLFPENKIITIINDEHWASALFSYERPLKEVLELNGFSNIKKYDWRKTEHASFDDHSQAYLPHMDKENGTLRSLNIE